MQHFTTELKRLRVFNTTTVVTVLVLGCWHSVGVRCTADVSQEHAASIISPRKLSQCLLKVDHLFVFPQLVFAYQDHIHIDLQFCCSCVRE